MAGREVPAADWNAVTIHSCFVELSGVEQYGQFTSSESLTAAARPSTGAGRKRALRRRARRRPAEHDHPVLPPRRVVEPPQRARPASTRCAVTAMPTDTQCRGPDASARSSTVLVRVDGSKTTCRSPISSPPARTLRRPRSGARARAARRDRGHDLHEAALLAFVPASWPRSPASPRAATAGARSGVTRRLIGPRVS